MFCCFGRRRSREFIDIKQAIDLVEQGYREAHETRQRARRRSERVL